MSLFDLVLRHAMEKTLKTRNFASQICFVDDVIVVGQFAECAPERIKAD